MDLGQTTHDDRDRKRDDGKQTSNAAPEAYGSKRPSDGRLIELFDEVRRQHKNICGCVLDQERREY